MNGFMVERIGKPVLMFVITYFAVRFLTGSTGDAVLVGLIPLVLGVINIFTNIGYALTAVLVIVSVAWGVTPMVVKARVNAQVYQATGVALSMTGKPVSSSAGATSPSPAPAATPEATAPPAPTKASPPQNKSR